MVDDNTRVRVLRNIAVPVTNGIVEAGRTEECICGSVKSDSCIRRITLIFAVSAFWEPCIKRTRSLRASDSVQSLYALVQGAIRRQSLRGLPRRAWRNKHRCWLLMRPFEGRLIDSIANLIIAKSFTCA